MDRIPSLFMAIVFCLTSLTFVSADPNVPGDDVVETSFSGTVTDSVTGEPIQNVLMIAYYEDYMERRADMTDENGEYYLEFSMGGHYTIFADDDNYEQGMAEATVEINTNTEIDFQLVPLEYDMTIFGIVTDSESGMPLDDVFVELWVVDEDRVTSYLEDTITGIDGKFLFEVVEGTYKVHVNSEGYNSFWSEDLVVNDGEDIECNVELVQWQTGVFGTVLDENGEPMENVSVVLDGVDQNAGEYFTVTDENGEYDIRVPSGREYNLKAYEDGYRTYAERIDIPQDTMVECDIDMTRAILPGPLVQFILVILQLIGVM